MTNNKIEVKNISLCKDGKKIINNISLCLNASSIAGILGPSGCGKTTLLRCIVGFEKPENGEIIINGTTVSSGKYSLAVEKRQIGMVFQDYALFPHLSVKENILFGLKNRKDKNAIQRLEELVELLSLQEHINKYPHCLSGGQQQRVALARAMAPHPKILLLDEPFANLDIELREQIAYELRGILKQEHISSIMVSHNQLEVFAMADIVGVMDNGSLMQWDTAFNLYHKPINTKIASLIGEGVFIPGQVVSDKEIYTELGCIKNSVGHNLKLNSMVSVLIRPDDILHDDDSPMLAKVKNKNFRGAEFFYSLEIKNGLKLLSLAPSHHNHAIGEMIGVRLEINHLVAFPEKDVINKKHFFR